VHTLLLDELRIWRAADGPPEWHDALDRVSGWFEPLWQGVDTSWDGFILLDGAAALALALYITAREHDIPVERVTREQVERLREPRGWDRVAAWEAKLLTLGHDPDDPHDPVSIRWRRQRRDLSPPDPNGLSDEALEDSTLNWGSMLSNGLDAVLAPIYNLRF
jgi:hypothetical protein